MMTIENYQAKMNVEMTAVDAVEIFAFLTGHGIKIHVDGGWGVDALLGEQTRLHEDLDIAVEHREVPKLRALFGSRGYAEVLRDDTSAWNFVLADGAGHMVDVHSYTFDAEGNHIFGCPYPVDSFTGIGTIMGKEVACISPERIVEFHTGYEPDLNDYRDVSALCERFGLELPSEYKQVGGRNVANIALLRLLQLSDSQFPVGSFAHSSGLETYAQMGLDKEGLAELLSVQLEHGFGRLDLAACALAYGSKSDTELNELCHEVTAWKPVPGLRETSLKLGKRLLVLTERIYPGLAKLALEESHYPTVFGTLGKRLSIDLEPLLLAFAQSTLTSSLAAATRCMSLSPEQAQEILTGLQPEVSGAVSRVLADPRANLFSATPALDVRAHQQAFLYSRLFQS